MELVHVASMGVEDAKRQYVSGGANAHHVLPLSGIKAASGGRRIECIAALPYRITEAPLLTASEAASWGSAARRVVDPVNQQLPTSPPASFFTRVTPYDVREAPPGSSSSLASDTAVFIGEAAMRAIESEAAVQKSRTASGGGSTGTNNTLTDDILNLPSSATPMKPGMSLRLRDRYVSYLYCGMSDGSVAQYGVTVSLNPSASSEITASGGTAPWTFSGASAAKPPNPTDPFFYLPGEAKHLLDPAFLNLAAPLRHSVQCEEISRRTLRSGDGPVTFLHCVMPLGLHHSSGAGHGKGGGGPLTGASSASEAQIVALRGNKLVMLNSLSLDIEPTFAHYPPLEAGVSLCCVATPASLGCADASSGRAAAPTGCSGKIAAIVKKTVVCLTFSGGVCRSYYGSGESTGFLSNAMSPKSTTSGSVLDGTSSAFDSPTTVTRADERTQQPITPPDNTSQIAWHLDCIILGTQKEYFVYHAITGQVMDQVTLDRAILRPDVAAAGLLPLLKPLPEDLSLDLWGDESAAPLPPSAAMGETPLVDFRLAENLLLETQSLGAAVGGGNGAGDHREVYGVENGVVGAPTSNGAVAVRLPHLRLYDGQSKEPLETARKVTFLNSEECYLTDYNHPVQMGMSVGFISQFNPPTQAQHAQFVKSHRPDEGALVFPYVPMPRMVLRHAFDLGQLPMHLPLPNTVTQHAGVTLLPNLPISVSKALVRGLKVFYHLAHTAGTKGQGHIISPSTLAVLGEGKLLQASGSKPPMEGVVSTSKGPSSRPMPTILTNPEYPTLKGRKQGGANGAGIHKGYIPPAQPTTSYPMLLRNTTSHCPLVTFFTVSSASSLCAAGLEQQQQLYESSTSTGGVIAASSIPSSVPVTQSHVANAHTIAVGADCRDVFCAVTLPTSTIVSQLALSGSYERALCFFVSQFIASEAGNRKALMMVASSLNGADSVPGTADISGIGRHLLSTGQGGCASLAVLNQLSTSTTSASGCYSAPLPVAFITSIESAIYDHNQQLRYLSLQQYTDPFYRIAYSTPSSVEMSAHTLADTLFSGDIVASAMTSAHTHLTSGDFFGGDQQQGASPLKPIVGMSTALASLSSAERCRLGLNHTHLLCGATAWNSRQFAAAIYHFGVCCGSFAADLTHLSSSQAVLASIQMSVMDVGCVLDAIPEFRCGFGQDPGESVEEEIPGSFVFNHNDSTPILSRLRNASQFSPSRPRFSTNAPTATSQQQSAPSPHFLPRLDGRSARLLQTVSLADLGADGCHQLARMLLAQRQTLGANIKTVRQWVRHHPAAISMQALASALKVCATRDTTIDDGGKRGGGGNDSSPGASPGRKVGFAIPSDDGAGNKLSSEPSADLGGRHAVSNSGPSRIPAELLAAAAYLKRLHQLADDVEYALLHLMAEGLAPFTTAESNGLFFPVCRLDLDECMPSLRGMMAKAEQLKAEAVGIEDAAAKGAKEEEASRLLKRCARFHSLLLSAAGRLTEALELCKKEGLVAEAVVPLQWSCFKPQEAAAVPLAASNRFKDPSSQGRNSFLNDDDDGGTPAHDRSRSNSVRILEGSPMAAAADVHEDAVTLFSKHLPWMIRKDPAIALAALTGRRTKDSTSAKEKQPGVGAVGGDSDDDEDGGDAEAFLRDVDEEEGDGLVGIVNVEDTDTDDDSSSFTSATSAGDLVSGESAALFNNQTMDFSNEGEVTPSLSSLRTASTQRARPSNNQQRRYRHKAGPAGKLVYSPPPSEAIIPIFLRNALRGMPLFAYLHHLIATTKTRDPYVHTLHALNLIEMVGAILNAVLPPVVQPSVIPQGDGLRGVAGLNDDGAERYQEINSWHLCNLDSNGRPWDDELLLPAGSESGVLGHLRSQLIEYLQRPTSMYDTDIVLVRLSKCEGAGWWNPNGSNLKTPVLPYQVELASVTLVPEQAAVHLRRGDDDQVLTTLVYGLNALELAEGYCDAQHAASRRQQLSKGAPSPQAAVTPRLTFGGSSNTPTEGGNEETDSGGPASNTLKLILVANEIEAAATDPSSVAVSASVVPEGRASTKQYSMSAALTHLRTNPLDPDSPLLHTTFYSTPLLRLLRVLLFPPRFVSRRLQQQNLSPEGAGRIDDAVELMERRASDLDAEEVLNMLPSSLEISRLSEFLRLSYQNQLHRSKMLSVINGCSGTYLNELAVQRSLLTQRCVYVDEQRPCVVCGKPLGIAVIGVFPNLKIAHFRCFKSIQVDPERLVPFTFAF